MMESLKHGQKLLHFDESEISTPGQVISESYHTLNTDQQPYQWQIYVQ